MKSYTVVATADFQAHTNDGCGSFRDQRSVYPEYSVGGRNISAAEQFTNELGGESWPDTSGGETDPSWGAATWLHSNDKMICSFNLKAIKSFVPFQKFCFPQNIITCSQRAMQCFKIGRERAFSVWERGPSCHEAIIIMLTCHRGRGALCSPTKASVVPSQALQGRKPTNNACVEMNVVLEEQRRQYGEEQSHVRKSRIVHFRCRVWPSVNKEYPDLTNYMCVRRLCIILHNVLETGSSAAD